MKAGTSAPWANSDTDLRRDPEPSEISGGFPCGPPDILLFNDLMFRLTQLNIEVATVISAAGLSPSASNSEQLLEALGLLSPPAEAIYWRLSGPTTTLLDDVTTQVGSFANALENVRDNVVDDSTGAITIGAEDAGVYVVTACYNTTSTAIEEAIRIRVNGNDVAVSANNAASDNSFLDLSISTVIKLVAGDEVTSHYRQKNSTSASRVLDNGERDQFSGVRIGS